MEEFGDKNAILQTKVGNNGEVSQSLKFVLVGFSLFFWILGSILSAIGGYVVSQSVGYKELSDFAIDPGVIVCVLGFVIFIMSTVGVLGTIRENLNLLKIYKIFLLVTLLFEVFCGFIAFAFWPEVKKIIDYHIAGAIVKYTSNVNLRNMIDMLQRQLQCCGSLTIDDWDSNPYYSCKNVESYKSCGVPWSCCLQKFYRNRQCGYGIRRNRVSVNIKSQIYTIGCMDKAFVLFKNNMVLIAGLALTFVFPLICGIFMIHMFTKQILRQIKVHQYVINNK